MRRDLRLTRRSPSAKLRLPASIAGPNYSVSRGLDQQLKLPVTSCQRIRRQRNVIITGPTGVGKSCMACALAHKACLEDSRTRYPRPPRLLKTLQTAREEGVYLTTLRQLAHIDVLVLDDWGLRRIRLP